MTFTPKKPVGGGAHVEVVGDDAGSGVIRHDEDVDKVVRSMVAVRSHRRTLQGVDLSRSHQPRDAQVVPFLNNRGNAERLRVEHHAPDYERPPGVDRKSTRL